MVEDVSPEQIKRVAEKALVIERYILERAWGICYAAAAASIDQSHVKERTTSADTSLYPHY